MSFLLPKPTHAQPALVAARSKHDLAANDGSVSVGIDHDRPVFAVTSIEAWWNQVGAKRCPDARAIFITAGAGGSNGYRSHVWKHELPRTRAPKLKDRRPLA